MIYRNLEEQTDARAWSRLQQARAEAERRKRAYATESKCKNATRQDYSATVVSV